MMTFKDVVEIVTNPGERTQDTDQDEEVCDYTHDKRGFMLVAVVDEHLRDSEDQPNET